MSLASIAGFPRRALLWVAALAVLAPASAWATEIYSSMEVPKAVGAANTTSTVTIDTNGRLKIGKITCSFYITHTWPRDLQISLLAPDGTRVYFTKFTAGGDDTVTGGDNRRGDANTGFGTGPDFAQRVTIDDGADGRDLHENPAAFIPGGSYQGYNDDMADFCNKYADGTWTLQIEDGSPAVDFGRLVCWSLHIEPIVHRYWTGGGNNTRLSNRFNWRDGVPPLPGEGAAALHFVGPAPAGAIINDIYRMTIAEMEVSGGTYGWMTLVNDLGWGPYPIAFADGAIISAVDNGALSVLSTPCLLLEHNEINAYNNYNRMINGVYYYELANISAHLRGRVNFNIAEGSTMAFEGMVMDWVRLHDVGNTGILRERLLGSVIKDLGGRLEFNCNFNADPGYAGFPFIPYGSRYTGETVIKNGVLSIAHNRGLGRFSYTDNNAQLQKVDTGTIVDGGTLELNNVTLQVTDDRLKINSEESLILRGLGYQDTGALRVAASPPAPASTTSALIGQVSLGYTTGAVVNEGDDINPLDPNSVGIGALERSTLRFDADNIGGDPLPIRIVGGTVAADGELIPGGTVEWYATAPLHFAVSERTTCNMQQNIRYDENDQPIEITPDNIPDGSILAVLNGGRLNFRQSCVNYNKTRPGGKLVTDINRAYRYVETVKSLQMGGGVLSVVNNGILQVLDGGMSTFSTTSEVTGPSQILGHLDFPLAENAFVTFNVSGDDTLAEHLILSYNENLDYQADDFPTQDSRLLNGFDKSKPIIDASGIIKTGRGTMALATHLTFQRDATVNAGGLVVSNNLRNVIDGTVVGNVTVNDGFVAGRGEVGAVLVIKGGVMPGRPAIEGATAYQLPTNQTLVIPRPVGPPLSKGVLTCDSVNFVSDKTTFTTGIYDPSGICDQLRIANTANGFVSLGMSGGASSSLRPLWRTADPAQGNQWMVIIDNGLNQLPNGNFTGMPGMPATLSPWVCYTFIKGATTGDDIQPHDPLEPTVPVDQAFIDKMTNGYSVAIRINGIVNFRPNSEPDEKLAAKYVVPEVNEADGSAVTVALPVDASGPGKVSYQTVDGTALAGVDYTPGEGQVDAPGTGPQVSITYNQTIRESRSLKVELVSPTNGLALGRPTMATIAILDVNQPDDEKTTGCGMSSGFAVFLLFIAGLGRLVVLRRRRD